MKSKDVFKYVFSDRNILEDIKHNPKQVDYEAIDSETVKGYIRLITYTEGEEVKYFYVNGFNDLIHNIKTNLDYRKNYFWFNLRYDADVFIKHIDKHLSVEDDFKEFMYLFYKGINLLINPDNRKLFSIKNPEDYFILEIPEIREQHLILHYVKNKFLQITINGHKYKFWDIAQFYANSKLDYACLNHLNICSKCGKNLNKQLIKILDKNKKLPKENKINIDNGSIICCENEVNGVKCNAEHVILRKIGIENEDYDNIKVLYQSDFREYALHDSFITKKLVKNFIQTIRDINVKGNYLSGNKLYSSHSLSKDYYFLNNNELNNLMKVELKTNNPFKERFDLIRYCINSYYGGRFESFGKGFYKHLYLIDVVSDYPYEISRLNSFHNAEIVYSKHLDKFFDYDDGILKVEINQKHNFINPFPYQKNNINNYGNGKFITFISLTEYKTFQNFRSDVLEINFIDGYFIKFKENKIFDYINDLFNYRKQLKKEGNPLEHAVKIIMNSFYGGFIQLIPEYELIDFTPMNYRLYKKTVEIGCKTYVLKPVRYKTGILFNPYYARTITGNARLKLLKPFINNKGTDYNNNINYLLNFATDSILTTRKLSNIQYSDSIGDFDIEFNDVEGVTLQNGIYQLVDKVHDKNKVRIRGFQTNKNIIELLENNLNSNEIIIPVKKKVSYTELYDVEGNNPFAELIDTTKEFNLNVDWKRKYKLNKIFTAGDLLENNYASECLSIKEFERKIRNRD